MPQLMLVRHAKSSWAEAGLTDFERPLNERGRRDAPVMGRRLPRLELVPDLIVSSPALRAISTARLLAQEIEYPLDDIELRAPIYEASIGVLRDVARSLDDRVTRAMLVGHNPGMSEFAKSIAACPFDEMPTCAVVVFDIGVKRWSEMKAKGGGGRLVQYLFPKDTR